LAFNISLVREVQITAVRLRFTCERLFQVGFGLRAFQLGHLHLLGGVYILSARPYFCTAAAHDRKRKLTTLSKFSKRIVAVRDTNYKLSYSMRAIAKYYGL
jgi:hypothetical protein